MAVTLKQIAEAAGVSRGTVDRVVHGRGRANPELEKRILALLKENDYQPNRFGQGLVMSGRPVKLGAIFQFSETPFMQMVIQGAERAQAALKTMNTEFIIENISSYDESKMLAAIDKMIDAGVCGLALTPGNSSAIHTKIHKLISAGIPVITLNSDAPDTGRTAYVGLDNYRAGQTAAGLMSIIFRNGGTILPISGYSENTSHSQRIQGFKDVAVQFPKLFIMDTAYCQDSDTIAEEIVKKALSRHSDLAGIYIAGNGQSGVCRALCRLKKTEDICVLCFDMTPQNIKELKSNNLDFIIDQDAEAQGYKPAMLLYDQLVLGKNCSSEYLYTDICIKTKFNL